MKTIKNANLIIVLFVLLFNNFFSFGQTMNLGPALTGIPGNTVDVPLNVNNMNNIGSMDIRITYDTTIMSFIGIVNPSADASGILYGTQPISGSIKRINLSWVTTGSTGVNFVNGKFLDLRFNYINGNSAIDFQVPAIEVLDYNGDPVNVAFTNSSISAPFAISNFNVTGTGSYCNGSSGLTVGLSGSQMSVNYQLKKDGINEGSQIPGTGNALSWTNKLAGTYTVEAIYNTTSQMMTGNAVISSTTQLAVAVSIIASSTTVTIGTPVNFTATPTNGGSNPSYQWQVNSINAGTNANTFSYTPSNADVVSCIMTSDLTFCITNNPAASNNISITVNQAAAMNLGPAIISLPNSVVNVPVNVSDMNNIGSMDIRITYDTTIMSFIGIVNPSADASGILYGTQPISGSIKRINLSWVTSGSTGVNFVNGKFLDLSFNYIGGNSTIDFQTATIEILDYNGDPVNVNFTNTSITEQFVINNYSVSGSGSYCSGSNGLTVGLSGSQIGVNYQLKKAGTNDGSTIPGTGSALSWSNKTAGTYTVEARYGTTFQTMSGSAIITSTSTVAVGVSISANSTTVLQGTSVNLTAVPTNGGSNPVYQWKVNNINAGTNSNTFSYIPSNLDVVKCVMTSDLTSCLSNNPATSNNITISVTADTAFINLGNTITAMSGTEILVPVNIDSLINAGSMDLRIQYDSTKLNFIDVVNISANASGVISNPSNVGGTIKQLNISWVADNSGINPNGKFLDLKFNYIGGNTTLQFNQPLCEVLSWDGISVYVNYSNVMINHIPVWTGNVNNIWENAANWTNNILPNSTSNVIIPVVTTHYPTVNFATTINNLTLESNATGTASLLDNSLLTVNGTANVKLYVTGNKWHMLSIPVQSATSGVFHLGSGQPDIYIKGFAAGNWTSLITNTTTPLVPTKGYAIWADTQTGSTPNPTITFTGAINIGNQPIATETGWTLIGNPYTSALDWNTLNLGNVEGQTVRVWNDALQLYSSYQLGGASLNGGSQYLSPMQAFFVKGLNANGISLTDANRVHNNQAFQKSGNTINDLVKIKAQASTYSDEIAFVYNTNATNSFDNMYDASKLFVTETSIPQIYSLAGNNELSINTFGSLPAAFPVNIKIGVADNVVMTASEFDNFDSNVSIKLEDISTGNIQDLRQNPVYSFAASANENANRFVLHFGMSPNSINEASNNNTNIYAYGKTIYVNTTESVKEISVYDMLGKQIISKVGNNKEIHSIAIDKASAFYMVRVITDKANYSEKVFIK